MAAPVVDTQHASTTTNEVVCYECWGVYKLERQAEHYSLCGKRDTVKNTIEDTLDELAETFEEIGLSESHFFWCLKTYISQRCPVEEEE